MDIQALLKRERIKFAKAGQKKFKENTTPEQRQAWRVKGAKAMKLKAKAKKSK